MAKKKVAKKTAKKNSVSRTKSSAKVASAGTHGGGPSKGRRKIGRPLVENALTQVVLSSTLAVGKKAFSKPDNYAAVEQIIEERAAEYKIVIESFEAKTSELHLFVRFKDRTNFQRFLKVVAGLIARKIGQAKKGKPLGRRFWDHLALTKTVENADGVAD